MKLKGAVLGVVVVLTHPTLVQATPLPGVELTPMKHVVRPVRGGRALRLGRDTQPMTAHEAEELAAREGLGRRVSSPTMPDGSRDGRVHYMTNAMIWGRAVVALDTARSKLPPVLVEAQAKWVSATPKGEDRRDPGVLRSVERSGRNTVYNFERVAFTVKRGLFGKRVTDVEGRDDTVKRYTADKTIYGPAGKRNLALRVKAAGYVAAAPRLLEGRWTQHHLIGPHESELRDLILIEDRKGDAVDVLVIDKRGTWQMHPQVLERAALADLGQLMRRRQGGYGFQYGDVHGDRVDGRSVDGAAVEIPNIILEMRSQRMDPESSLPPLGRFVSVQTKGHLTAYLFEHVAYVTKKDEQGVEHPWGDLLPSVKRSPSAERVWNRADRFDFEPFDF